MRVMSTKLQLLKVFSLEMAPLSPRLVEHREYIQKAKQPIAPSNTQVWLWFVVT